MGVYAMMLDDDATTDGILANQQAHDGGVCYDVR